MEYADDISKASSDFNEIRKFKEEAPKVLSSRGLQVNKDKTEEYVINNNNENNEWRNCKLLGSLLDTTADINRRKTLAIAASKNILHILNNKRITLISKLKKFNAYIQPIFLYNCEIWAVNKTIAEKIDQFHRKLIRNFVLNVKWPQIISNESLYEKTKVIKWSELCRKRRLKFFGKVNRMDKNIPVRKAMNYALEKYKRKKGRPTTTWLSTIKDDLRKLDLTWNEAVEISKEKDDWDNLINNN